MYDVDFQLANARVCYKITRRHVDSIYIEQPLHFNLFQIFSNSVSNGLKFYLSHNYKQFEGYEATADFCLRINNIFDALNRKQPNQGLMLDSKDFKVIISPYKFFLLNIMHIL